MTQCTLLRVHKQRQFYSTSARKARYAYKGKQSVSKIISDYLLSFNIPKSQAYFWTPDWISAEKSADEDIRNNRLHVSRTAEEIIAYLNSPD